ncbi:hypothetical protein BJY00DRAFT_293571 [Aspergillus carlsbadensis]|nr:hypothetical protein BJY00DRAFT_293571 [Aspergillus carlsbadensis]
MGDAGVRRSPRGAAAESRPRDDRTVGAQPEDPAGGRDGVASRGPQRQCGLYGFSLAGPRQQGHNRRCQHHWSAHHSAAGARHQERAAGPRRATDPVRGSHYALDDRGHQQGTPDDDGPAVAGSAVLDEHGPPDWSGDV